MRNAFANELELIAETDPRVVLLSGDIGNRLFNSFKEKFTDRFYNCGVAEANMASMAAGLAMCGLRPITYTITPFNTTRCLEQIRDDICYHNQPVIIVGVGAGLSYANLGCTHHSCEDLAFLRALPNMTVLCPADSVELRILLRKALSLPGPVYLRIGKKGEPVVTSPKANLSIGRASLVKQGKDLCVISTGNMLPTATDLATELETKQITTAIISMHTIKPLDTDCLKSVFSTFPCVVSLEEHSMIGGLGGAICEWLVDNHILFGHFLRFGTPDCFPKRVGSQTYLRTKYLLTADAMAKKIADYFTSRVSTTAAPEKKERAQPFFVRCSPK